MQNVLGPWQAIKNNNTWQIVDGNNQIIAMVADIPDAETKAKQIAIAPFVFDALKSVVELLGDEDIPDNGELSGAAISDLARAAVEIIGNY